MNKYLLLTIVFFWSFAGSTQSLSEPPETPQPNPVDAQLTQFPSLTEYYKTAPLYVVGSLRFEQAHRLFHDQIGGVNYLEGSIQPNKDLNIWLSKTELRITTNGGLRVTIAKIPMTVKSLIYNNVTGSVEVKSSVLGIDAGETYIERRMSREIQNKFRPKLQEAFTHLIRVRQQKSLSDAGHVLNEVINVFKAKKVNKDPNAKPGTPLPTFTGEVTLVTLVPKAQTVRIGQVVADIQQGEGLQSSVLIRVPSRCKMQIRGVMFSTTKGIVLRQPKTAASGVKTAILKSFSATEGYGFQINATNGADDILNGGKLLIHLIRAAAHDRTLSQTEAELNQIDPISFIQQIINAKAQGALKEYVQKYREDLLKAGATPELLDALQVEHAPVGDLPFIYPSSGH